MKTVRSIVTSNWMGYLEMGAISEAMVGINVLPRLGKNKACQQFVTELTGLQSNILLGCE